MLRPLGLLGSFNQPKGRRERVLLETCPEVYISQDRRQMLRVDAQKKRFGDTVAKLSRVGP
jgi:hypothetical protein